MQNDGLSFKEKVKDEIKDWLCIALIVVFCAFAIYNDKKQQAKQIRKPTPDVYLNDSIKQHIR